MGLDHVDLGRVPGHRRAGLNSGKGWARVLAIVVACVSILIQTLFLAAFPIWSVIIIALDVIVIYALTARWGEARAGL